MSGKGASGEPEEEKLTCKRRRGIVMDVLNAAAVLRVADVSRSIAWYVEMFGFEAHPFFEEPTSSRSCSDRICD
jgi:hypothetical protein